MVNQGIESVEEFFLRRLFARNELDIVDHQHIHRPEALFERHGIFVPKCAHELIHEFFSREVKDLSRWIPTFDLPGNRMHQVGLSKTDRAIQEQRIERHI